MSSDETVFDRAPPGGRLEHGGEVVALSADGDHGIGQALAALLGKGELS